MRVIAGRLRHRRLRPPTWPDLRPTSDRLRQTLFDILGVRIEGAHFVDGFAGTGAVGIEALSRGAAHVTFIEADRRALDLIARNLASLGVAEGYTVAPRPVEAVLGDWQTGAPDVIFLDPPYQVTEGDLSGLLALTARVVAASGLVIIEHAARRDVPAAAPLVRVREVRVGDSALSFYRPGNAAEAAAEEPRR